MQGDLFAALPAGEQFEIIASNPPYIADGEQETLQNDVRRYEPPTALFAGPKGTEVLFRILDGAGARLMPGGTLLLEISSEQADAVRSKIESTGAYDEVRVLKDAGGLLRVARARKLTAARSSTSPPA